MNFCAAARGDAAKLRAHDQACGIRCDGFTAERARTIDGKGRNESTTVRSLYQPEWFHRLKTKQVEPNIVYATIARFGTEAVKNALTAVNDSAQPALVALHCQWREAAWLRVSAIHTLSVE